MILPMDPVSKREAISIDPELVEAVENKEESWEAVLVHEAMQSVF